MTNSSKKVPESKGDPMAAAMGSMIAMNPMQETALKAMFAMGTETLQFLSSRMQQDLEIQKAMLSCKTLQDLQKVQADFYKTALEDYRNAASRMREVMSNSQSTDGKGQSPLTKRGYDDVPL